MDREQFDHFAQESEGERDVDGMFKWIMDISLHRAWLFIGRGKKTPLTHPALIAIKERADRHMKTEREQKALDILLYLMNRDAYYRTSILKTIREIERDPIPISHLEDAMTSTE